MLQNRPYCRCVSTLIKNAFLLLIIFVQPGLLSCSKKAVIGKHIDVDIYPMPINSTSNLNDFLNKKISLIDTVYNIQKINERKGKLYLKSARDNEHKIIIKYNLQSLSQNIENIRNKEIFVYGILTTDSNKDYIIKVTDVKQILKYKM